MTQLRGLARDLLWRLRSGGVSQFRIGQAIGVTKAAITAEVSRHGGVAPRPHRRRVSALRAEEREEISRGLVSGRSLRWIAKRLCRSPSTIQREVTRNGGQLRYRAGTAERRAARKSRRPQTRKLFASRRLRRWVVAKLHEDWSPQQISQWLRLTFADDAGMQVSHETIYRTLFVQTRGELRKELTQHLRTHRVRRRPRGSTASSPIVDGVSISERPAEVEDRAVPGHWEGDLLVGTPSSRIATLVERSTRYVILVKVDSRDTKTVTAALRKRIRRLPDELRKTLTWDRGSELSSHKQLAVAADIDIYFCDPASPWQRGSNENTNGLLRQYFPKGQSVSHHDQRSLNAIARRLNTRPRETLGWKTPAQVLAELLQ